MSNNAIDNFKQKWAAMKPAARQRAMLALMVGGFAAVASLGYFVSGGADKAKTNVRITAPEKKNIALDPKMLERSITHETNKNADEIADLKKQIEDMKKGGTAAQGMPGTPPGMITQDPKLGQGAMGMNGGMPPTLSELQAQQKGGGMAQHGSGQKAQQSSMPPAMPPLPPPQPSMAANRVPPPPGAAGVQQGKPAEIMVGDIEIVSAPKSEKKDADSKKKEKTEIYLPPSFMEADLLTGLNAPATESARGNPLPVLIRIKKLAILPNKLKADLKGCFIIAEGHGNLADERAHLRLVNVSCVAKNGEAVIDQPITGAVYDSDGKLGLTGRVVSRMGATIVRSLIAGFFGGFGEAMKQSSQSTSLTALGTVTTPTADLDKMAVAGAGQGIADAAKEIQKFYLELAKQAIPVIEVSGARHVTVAITKGIKLEVRNVKTNAH